MNEPTTTVTLRIPTWLANHLQKFANKKGITRSEAGCKVLKGYFGYK